MRNHTHTPRHCLRRCPHTSSLQLPSSICSSLVLSFLLLVVHPYRLHHWFQETLDIHAACRAFLEVVGVPSILHTDSLRIRLILASHEGLWFKGGIPCIINEACSLSSHWSRSSRSLPAVPPRRHRPPRLAPQRAATPSPSPSRQQEWHLTLTLFLCLRAHMSRSPSRTRTASSHTIWHSTRQRQRQPSSTREQG